jgi:hypothetical protein
VTKADNSRAWMQTPEWLDFHWRPYAKTCLATLRDGSSGEPIPSRLWWKILFLLRSPSGGARQRLSNFLVQ